MRGLCGRWSRIYYIITGIENGTSDITDEN